MLRLIRPALLAVLFVMTPLSLATVMPYSQNFEGLTMSDTAALSNDGWLVAGLVFTSAGAFKFFYGNFPAPNGGPGFSAIATGEGGAEQGLQYLNVYSDYNCCQPNEGHFPMGMGTDKVESNVFQQQTIDGTTDAGVWVFSFDAKMPAMNGCATSAASCLAFIKTISGTILTNNITVDTSNLSTQEWTRQSLQIPINTELAGQTLQVGFSSTSSNFQNTGVFYDNINLAPNVSCPADLVLANQTLSGTQTQQASTSITLGPNLIASGTAVTVRAPTVTMLSDTRIEGTFTAGNTTTCT